MSVESKLDHYFHIVSQIVLSKQNACTGLIPASVAITSHGDYTDAWVRDNVYSILCVYGLALAYKRIDDDHGRAYELEHSVIKCMRGLLFAMMKQGHKVEKFKNTQAITDSLHAKYNTKTADTVVEDHQWGHLQIDATSIFLLALAQMTASGFRIIYTLDEVNFVQNLIYYIERAYRTPDYGIWERGNKINHGQPELNSSSIGMAVAALQACSGINLFGARGGASSVIHVLPDELTRNWTTLHSALPRESNSKEIDAALLSVISFPAFAVHDFKLADKTRMEIIKKLSGKYGFKRFLRDGHQTVLEDTSRLHYDPHELNIFEHIECEWPLFFTYMILDGFFRNDNEQVMIYRELLENTLIDSVNFHPSTPISSSSEGGPHSYRRNSCSKSQGDEFNIRLVPELYKVPADKVNLEKENPKSQIRTPNENVPLVWAQSLYILGNLIHDDLLSTADLDPLGRRFVLTNRRQKSETMVQVVLLAEDAELQAKLAMFGLETQTIDQCAPIIISPPAALRDAYAYLGENKKLNLSGRPKRPIGTLSTCKIYRCEGQLYAFLPHFMDKEEFYLVSDNDYLVTVFEQELSFVKNHWHSPGRPTMLIMLTNNMLAGIRSKNTSMKAINKLNSVNSRRNLLNFMMGLRTGICSNVRVRLGRLSEMINTSCLENLDFLVGTDAIKDDDNVLTAYSKVPALKRLNFSEKITQASKQSLTRLKNRSIKRKSSTNPKNNAPEAHKSPLLSPFSDSSMDEDMANFKLKDHEDESPTHSENYSGRHSQAGKTIIGLTSRQSSINSDEFNHHHPSSLTLILGDHKNVDAAIHHLEHSANLFDQVDILHYLQSCKGDNFMIKNLGTICSLLEEVYIKAMQLKLWSIVRQTAGLLKKNVNSLTINTADLLVRQKPVTIGFGKNELFITSPRSPSVLSKLIYEHCDNDVREAPLVQEVITYLGSFIRSNNSMFDGIIRLRTHFLIIAMRDEITRMKNCDEEEAIEHLMGLSPFQLKSLLGAILTAKDQTLTNNNSDSLSILPASKSRATNSDFHSLSKIPNTSTGYTTLTIRVQSGGFLAGNFAFIEVKCDGNTQEIPCIFGRGLNVVIIDSTEGTIIEGTTFDTHISSEESDELAKLIEWMDPGMIIIVAVKDEAHEHLTENAKAALESIGSSLVRSIGYRDSFCLIGEKGAIKGTISESLVNINSGPTEILQKSFDLQSRKRQLTSSRVVSRANSMTFLGHSQGKWLRRRKNDGALNRVPPEFYPKVWKALSKCTGFKIGAEVLLRDPTISEKTPEEFNFALQVESFLDYCRDPAERAIIVECLMVISKIEERNPELKISGVVDLLKIVKLSMRRFWKSFVIEEFQRLKREKNDNVTITSNQIVHDLFTEEDLNLQDPFEGYEEEENLDQFSRSPSLECVTSHGNSDTNQSVPEKKKSKWSKWSFAKHEKYARRLFFDLSQDGSQGTLAYLGSSCMKVISDFNIEMSNCILT